MKLTIFTATGGIGRQVLEQAVIAGHDVKQSFGTRRSCPETGARSHGRLGARELGAHSST